MNQKLKQVGLFAILAVFSMSLTTSFVGDAEASSSKDPKFRALIEELKTESSPSLKLVLINDPATRPGTEFVVSEKITTFKVVYAVVNPTNVDLRNVEILVTSDIESVKAELRGSHDGDRSIISFEIDAVDPASVNAQITGYEI
ncbi:MAG: hypothetical protein QQN61_04745 [Nitrosopumilus sp.]